MPDDQSENTRGSARRSDVEDIPVGPSATPPDGSTDLEGVWTVLETHRPRPGEIETSPCGVDVTAGPVLVGVDASGQRHLLVPLRPGEAAPTDTRAAGAQLTRVTTPHGAFLSVVCLDRDLRSVFGQFARELLTTIRDETVTGGSPARETAVSFGRWRSLFTEPPTVTQASEQVVVGLFGELRTLTALLRAGADGGLDWWTGPLRHQHDFRAPALAIEAKSTLAREGRVVGIHGVDQLDAPTGTGLWLAHHQFERDPAGQNLATAVRQAHDAGAEPGALSRLVRSSGATDIDLDPASTRRYRHLTTRVYDVLLPGFPRITRSHFGAGDIPAGTLNLDYSIDLTNEPPHPLSSPAADTLQARFASATTGSTSSTFDPPNTSYLSYPFGSLDGSVVDDR